MALTVIPSNPVPGMKLWVYDNLKTTDTSPSAIEPGGVFPLIGAMQVIGTFGGASVALQGSNDKVNWVPLKDTGGTTIAIAASGAVEFSTAMRYIRPLATGGSGDDLDVLITLRS